MHARLFETVLITGCRFEIGQGLCRILKETGAAGVVIGSDFTTDHPGTLIFDHFEQTVRPDHPGYFDSIRKIVRARQVDLIVPMSEAEIFLFTGEGYFDSFEGVPLLTPNKKAILIGQDKLTTMRFFAEEGIPHPWTVTVGEQDPPDLPCVIKPRRGNEGENVLIVGDSAMVPIFRRTRPSDIWQELLLPEEEEYTCGLFRSRAGEVRSICFRRRLQGGYTSAGEVVRNDDVAEYLYRIAEALDLQGSVNVQLKLTRDGPRAFEINPRFSSTVMFRHLLGFQDLIWTMKDMMGMEVGPFEPAEDGVRFYRCPRELIVAP
jgi:carbamoyl-phosphate synthase large subunit